jgi:1-deoxyxylulose-5-phosphate synthase
LAWRVRPRFANSRHISNPAITPVILGASRLEQLTDTLAAADSKLDSAVKAKLDEVSLEYRRGDAGR